MKKVKNGLFPIKKVNKDALVPINYAPNVANLGLWVEDSTDNCIIVPTIALKYGESVDPRIRRGCF